MPYAAGMRDILEIGVPTTAMDSSRRVTTTYSYVQVPYYPCKVVEASAQAIRQQFGEVMDVTHMADIYARGVGVIEPDSLSDGSSRRRQVRIKSETNPSGMLYEVERVTDYDGRMKRFWLRRWKD